MPQFVIAAAAVIGEAVTVVTTSATIGAMVANAVAVLGFAQGVTAAVSAWTTVASLAALARGRPKVGGVTGTQVDFKADTRAGIPYPIGETGLGGNIVFATTAETKNAHLLYLTIHGFTGPGIGGLDEFRVNDEVVTFAGDNAVNARYHNKMWERRQIGSNVPATFYPPATTLGSFTDWTAAHKLTGYTGQWWVLEYDQKAYPQGTPKPLTIGRWVWAYDPRLDSTYPGGSGPQRSNDETTWSFTKNAPLHALTYCLGRYSNAKRVIGLGALIAMIDVASFVEAANVNDANGWEIGGVVYSTDDKYQVLAAMLQAGGAWPSRLGAKISCGINAPKVSIATLTGDDQAEGEVTIAAVRSKRDKFNGVIPSYRSADHGYEVVPASKISVADYLAADGGDDLTCEPEFILCPDVDQAAQLGTYVVANSRELGPITIPCKPRWWGYRPNDCVTINEPEWGLIGQKVVIVDRTRNPTTGVVNLSFVTETDGKHPFCLGKTGTPPPSPSLTAITGDYLPTPDVGTWTASGLSLSGAGVVPAITITGAIDAVLATSVIVDYRERLTVGPPATFGPWVTREYPSSAAKIVISDVKPGATYQVQVRYRNAHGVEDPNSATVLGLVTVGAVVSSIEADVGAPGAPTSLAATAAFETVALSWVNPADTDLDRVEIWENTVNTQPNPVTQPALQLGVTAAKPGANGSYVRVGLSPGVTRYYWVRAVDRAGNVSAFNATGGTSATTLSLGYNDFGTGVKPIGRGNALPTASTYDGDLFYLTTDQKIYRKDAAGTAWISTTAAVDVSGTLTDAQLAAIAAAKITGQITTTQIGPQAVTTSRLAAGAVTANEIAANTITAAKIAAGAITATEIAANTITASKIAAGTITSNELAANSVIAAKIAAGIITSSHIAANTITGGNIAAGTITASNIAAGTLTADRIATGTLTANEIAASTITAAKIVGGAITTVTWDEQAYGAIVTAVATQIFSVTHTTTEAFAPHVIHLNATVANGAGNTGVLLRIKRDGTEFAQRSWVALAAFTSTGSFMLFDQPGAGSHTYSITAEKTSGSGSAANLTVSNMTVTELKR